MDITEIRVIKSILTLGYLRLKNQNMKNKTILVIQSNKESKTISLTLLNKNKDHVLAEDLQISQSLNR